MANDAFETSQQVSVAESLEGRTETVRRFAVQQKWRWT
jgi:hypothetical protein